jgi:hypothetical protein
MSCHFRRLVVVICSIGTCLLIALAIAPSSVVSQADITDAEYESTIESYQTEVAELEGTVAARGQKINAQRTQIAELKNPAATARPEAPDVITVSGVGTTLSEGFDLEAGNYRVTAVVQSYGYSFFIMQMYGTSADLGFEGYVFNESAEEGGGAWEISTVFSAPRDDTYFAEVSNTDAAWTVTFEKLS